MVRRLKQTLMTRGNAHPHFCHQTNIVELILSFNGKIKKFKAPDLSVTISAYISQCPELEVPPHVGAIHQGICYLPDYFETSTFFEDGDSIAYVTLVKGKTNV